MTFVGVLLTVLYVHNGFVHGTENGTSEDTATTEPDTYSSEDDNSPKEGLPIEIMTPMENTFFAFSKSFTKSLELWNKTLREATVKCFKQNVSDPDQVAFSVKINVPVFTAKNSEISYGEFLPFDDLQPVLVRKKEKQTTVNAASLALLELFPLLLLCLSCAALSGIVVWALDNRANSSEFPRKNFWKGISDGIWWAVVTMTTVGYGDKAPKSFFARLFGTVWMISGIILLSMFTAQVSSRLTTQELKNEDHVFGKKVGIPIGFDSERSFYVEDVLQHAIIKDYYSTSEFIKALTDGTWDSALIFHCDNIETDNSYEVLQLLKKCVVGAEVYIESDEWTTYSYDSYIKCMKARTATKRPKKRREHRDHSCKKLLKEKESNTLTFNWVYFKNLQGYIIPLGIVIAMVLISFGIGGIWDFRQRKKRASTTSPPREADIKRLPSQQEQFVMSGKIPLEQQNV